MAVKFFENRLHNLTVSQSISQSVSYKLVTIVIAINVAIDEFCGEDLK